MARSSTRDRAAIKPGAVQALRDLIHAANTTRDAGHHAIDPALRDELIRRFRHGVLLGLSEVDRDPDPKAKQPPGHSLPEVLRDRTGDILRLATTCACPRLRTRPSGTYARRKSLQKISGRLTHSYIAHRRC
jgi:transposase